MSPYTSISEEDNMKVVTINLPKPYLAYIKTLMDWGITPSRSEYVRRAVEDKIREDMKLRLYIDEVIEASDEDTVWIPAGDGTRRKHKILRRLG
jgi:Arc/MetJ-type ribon-helix-helix transcriptional regulator